MMQRGELVRVALQGDYGKPHPALIVQADMYSNLPSVTVLPLTSDLRELLGIRVVVAPNASNGLRLPSQIMVDKAVTVVREKIGPTIGYLSGSDMGTVNRALAAFLGFT
jgi:mRNA interferase MazF